MRAKPFAPLLLVLLWSCTTDAPSGPGGPDPNRPTAVNVASGNTQSGMAGSALGSPLVVRVLNASGQGVAGVAVTWSVTQGGGSIAAGSAQTDAGGQASATWTLGTTAGPNGASATVQGLTAATFTATGVAGPGARLARAGGDEQSAPAGAPVADSIAVRVLDAHDNVVAGATVQWEVTAGGGTVSPASSTSGANGVARARWTLGPTAGETQSLAASLGALPALTFSATALSREVAITGISPATLVPGQTATITGVNFSATAAENVVTIGGAPAIVTAASATQLQVTAPCVASGRVEVVISVSGASAAPFEHPLQVTRRHTLAQAQSVVVTDGSEVACNEIAPAGGAARYLLAVYNTSTTPTAGLGFRIAGSEQGATGPASAPAPVRVASPSIRASAHEIAPLSSESRHYELLEKNRAEFERLMREHGRALRDPSRSVTTAVVEPAVNREIRVSNVTSGSICTNFFTVQATRIYYSEKLAIYEDDATPNELKAANNPTMAAYYQRIGDEFNADMEPILRNHFGDVLRRDAVTDNNGVLIALFTPLFSQFPGIAGFVVSCDQFPNAANNTASNFGEFFYARMPGATLTPENWFRSIRSTFIHEGKHSASMSARVANNAPFEETWLEEGTARHSEELWGRAAVYGVPWKGNTGYGSATQPNSLWCDIRPTTAVCNASNPRRPAMVVFRHFNSIFDYQTRPGELSPFGPSERDASSVFYAASWSLVRYAIDRYAGSEADFLTALTQAASTGTTTLVALTGISAAELLGRWALSHRTDDVAGLTSNLDLQVQTWNVPAIFAGMNADLPAQFPTATPLAVHPLGFGAFAPVAVSGVVGGGISFFEISGNQTAAQIIRLAAEAGGGPPPAPLRMAIVRIQ